MNFDVEKLYSLLPAIYRVRDDDVASQLALLLTFEEENELQQLAALGANASAEQSERRQELSDKKRRSGGPLKALLSIIAEQVAVLEDNLDQLYDDLFIETCAEWVVPYIGDLVGARNLFAFSGGAFTQRAFVANTVAYRRRKGTATVIEQLARDVTGWSASVVEYFQLLTTTQYMNHLRPENLSIASVRHESFSGLYARSSSENSPYADDPQWKALEYANTTFDTLTHTADVRRIASRRGRYNIPNIGVFLYRLINFPVTQSSASRLDARRYFFDPLGRDISLFNQPLAEAEISHLAEPLNVPMPISRRVLDRCFDTYYGLDAAGALKSLLLNVNGTDVLPPEGSAVPVSPPELTASDLVVCNLSDVKDAGGNIIGWAHKPKNKIAIDPVLGRIAFPENRPAPTTVTVSYHYGFSAAMGGGEYGRERTFIGSDPAVSVPEQSATIQQALDQIAASGGVVEIRSSATFEETLTIRAATNQGKVIELRAADQHRPVLILSGDLTVFGADESEVTLNGLWISGSVRVPVADNSGNPNKLRLLRLRHCTIVPQLTVSNDSPPALTQPRISLEAPNTNIEIDHSIVGAIRAAAGADVAISHSIVDAAAQTEVAYAGISSGHPGAPLSIENSTIIGSVFTQTVQLASNTIFVSAVRAERLQQGCMRFSFVPPGSRVPRMHRCQPAASGDAVRVRPVFSSLRLGDADYCQLSGQCPLEIRSGADDGAEMGAFHDLYQPQREANLRAALDEYLRFGLEAGIFFAT
ncbi:MAG TPA: hypothetical protein VFY96_09790 [Candidatus Binatia bacterium]|nr:hypothetical protein [Candidatus Binatia bacterium]